MKLSLPTRRTARRCRFGLAALSVLLLPGAAVSASQTVDIELVLAIDCSVSVSRQEYELQARGLAWALRDPAVKALIAGHPNGVAVTVAHWSTGRLNAQPVPWQVLKEAAGIERFASLIEAMPRSAIGDRTAIGIAMQYAAGLIEANGFAGRRRVIDVSGDGRNNSGPHPSRVRDLLVTAGYTINGLAIRDGDRRLDAYFGAYITGGPGSFVIAADRFADYPRAMRLKLLRELAPQVSGTSPPAAASASRVSVLP